MTLKHIPHIDDSDTWFYKGIVTAMQAHTDALKKLPKATAKGDGEEVTLAIAAAIISIYGLAECYGISKAVLDEAMDKAMGMLMKDTENSHAAERASQHGNKS